MKLRKHPTIARAALARLGIRPGNLGIKLRELSVCSELILGLEKGLDCFDVFLFYLRFPFTEGTRGNLEPCLRWHMTTAQLRIRKGFRHEVSATLGRFDEVFAPFAYGEAVIPLLSCYEEHLSGFFG